jgi:transmembrane sensor
MLHPEQINELIRKSQRAETTVEEEMLLLEWVSSNPIDPALLDNSNDLGSIMEELKELENIPTEGAEEKVFDKWEQVKTTMRVQQTSEKGETVTTTRKRIHLFTYIAAASVIAVIGIFAYRWLNTPVKKTRPPTVAGFKPTKDASPGTDKAKLILADGSEYIIEDTASGFLARDENRVFTRKGGIVFCNVEPGTAAPPETVRYYTLEIPRGGRYQLVLPDGSRIWLNAESRLQFPAVDTGNTRMVTLTGEAYFDVAANKPRPFMVKVFDSDAELKVTGTRFNVKAYADGSMAKATLEEGRLSVNSGGLEVDVARSYSASFSKGGKPTVEREPDMYKTLAWKDKKFWWNGDSLTTALREVARWYNVTLQYDDMPDAIVGTVLDDRSKPLTEVLDVLMTNTNYTYELIGSILHIRKQRTALKMQNKRKYHNLLPCPEAIG